MPQSFVQFKDISKHFGGVNALTEVSLSIVRGEVHGLMGENGAGKSTLGKVLAGIHTPDAGQIILDGQVRHFRNPADALAAGVGMVHQELAFCPDLSVAENLCMGRYPRTLGFLSRRKMADEAERLLEQIGVKVDVSRPMHELTTGQEQSIQIAAAVGTNARVIVFDEPTASLSTRESDHLFELIGRLKARGITLIYVSHRMPEILALCDSMSVLRDGKYVGSLTRAEATQDRIVEMMTGRVIKIRETGGNRLTGREMMTVNRLTSPGKFADVKFNLHAGEIVCMAGLVGAGRSETAQAIFGMDPKATGQVTVEGNALSLRRIRESMRRGIALVPEDRKRQGLVLMMSCSSNGSMAVLDTLRRGPFLNYRKERVLATDMFARLRIKAAGIDAPVNSLSGGNQQKVVLAKWLARGAKVLIVDEPTRGVDIGAKQAIHDLLHELASQGTAILVISSELPEVLALADRIIVMREGHIAAELPRAAADEQTLLRHMAGVGPTSLN
ncbi:MAG: sugar ABC transporter ATP-binding protein [Burkholderiales bacterium]|nr:sugar ABC transporter ATP-binding protein [Phycisphaerae bacterium]